MSFRLHESELYTIVNRNIRIENTAYICNQNKNYPVINFKHKIVDKTVFKCKTPEIHNEVLANGTIVLTVLQMGNIYSTYV